jgi:hypothetical protein
MDGKGLTEALEYFRHIPYVNVFHNIHFPTSSSEERIIASILMMTACGYDAGTTARKLCVQGVSCDEQCCNTQQSKWGGKLTGAWPCGKEKPRLNDGTLCVGAACNVCQNPASL